MLDRMKIENQIKEMGDRALLEFVARQQIDITDRCALHEKRLHSLESSEKRAALIGTLVGGAVSLIITIGAWFVKVK